MNEIAKTNTLEKVILSNDLTALTPNERMEHYRAVCDSIGLNPLTNPFQYIVLNNKLTLYATKACTDQLRQIKGISINISEQKRDGDVYIVTVTARDSTGREDTDVGVVHLAKRDFKSGGSVPMTGDDLANAIMKCITKAKRRVTLSICGLGMLDESEVETIPNAKTVDVSALHRPVGGEVPRLSPQKTLNDSLDSAYLLNYVVPVGEKKGVRLGDMNTEQLIEYHDTLKAAYAKSKNEKALEIAGIVDQLIKHLMFPRAAE